jgi:hypothetical protein
MAALAILIAALAAGSIILAVVQAARPAWRRDGDWDGERWERIRRFGRELSRKEDER